VNNLEFVAIPPEGIQASWPVLRPGVADVLKLSMGIVKESDVLANCTSGKWLLFAVFDNDSPVVVLVADIKQGDAPLFDVGFCWGCRVDEWISDVCTAFEVVAAQCGCAHLAFNGRAGWSRLAKSHGFKVNAISYIKELSNGRE
jgi:hypothetical protein